MSKIGWVFEGGSVFGAWQGGVMWKLHIMGIRPDKLYGTSVGALNAAIYSFVGPEKGGEMWMGIRGVKDVLSFNLFSLLWADGLYSMKPLKKLIDDNSRGAPQFDSTVCYVESESGETKYVSCMETDIETFRKAVLASASMPVIMQPVDSFLDGGVREQIPLSKAIEDGCDEIYVVLTAPWQRNPDPWHRPTGMFKWLKYGLRAFEIILHESAVNDVRACARKNSDPAMKSVKIHLFAPKKRFFAHALDFDPKKIRAAYEDGAFLSREVQIEL